MKSILGILFFSLSLQAETLVTSLLTASKVTVKVVNMEMNSGGSGSVILSSDKGSLILTNRHVCGVVENGGLIEHAGKAHLVTHIKKYAKHDLCLVRIRANLNINLKLAETSPVLPDYSLVSGHPQLLPNIITTGHFSDKMDVNIIVGLNACTGNPATEDPLMCMFLGGMPIIETFESQVVTNLIEPGSSGSAVYNQQGEIAGVVFAGSEGLSRGFIVPLTYVLDFVNNRNNQEWVKVGNKKAEDNATEVVSFNFKKCRDIPATVSVKVKDLCRKTKDTLIYTE